ncbi:uncharacterized protein LOC129000423 [Macrosteles quadrilineatus]|uniref:uncharacterized protein LOC129000423 n=1 Tax=Macrosteles quadrilineatus TaxID=74068 RepID=UPI0023E2E112|nr:uncharacterized protein LOC129000423 [Macrosteles quadrilineatus]
MGPCRGRLWWPVVALLAAAAVSVTNAQVNAVNSLNKAQNGRESSKLSPLGHHQLHDDPNHLVENDKTRLNQKEENPHVINAGHQPLTFVKHAHKRRVISKREAKKPKNTKRRVKFNKKEFEKKLQQQEKEEKESGVAKDESTVDTSEVLSSSNSLIPEFSDLYMPWNLPPRPTKSRMPKKSEAKSHPSEISTCEDPTEEMYDPPKRYEKEVIFED